MSKSSINAVSHNQRFINNPASATLESLLGLVISSPNIALLDFAKVVIRRDYHDMHEVKIVSGGCSGHEPAYAGFVGKGMLTAAIQGDIYTSPSSSDVLQTLRELTDEQGLGTLIIIPNSPGNRLNFGLAVERAKNEGIKVELIIVSDDCANFQPKQGRGLCGPFLLQKVAGAMAQNGAVLSEIYNKCKKLEEDIFSILLSIKPCSNHEKTACESCRTVAARTEMEIGAGLHGEKGAIKMSITAVEYVCKMIFEQMMNENNARKLQFEKDVPIVLFINNLGATSKMEEHIFTKEVLKSCKSFGINVIRVYCDRYLTSLDMYGFSVTIMKIRDSETLEMLDQACEAPSWRSVTPFMFLDEESIIIRSNWQEPQAIEMRGPRLTKRQMNTLLLVTQFVCDALISCEKQLNVIDAESGDGDTGTRLRRGAETINIELQRHNLNFAYPFAFLLSLSKLLDKDMGGILGCIYSIMLEAAAKEFLSFAESDQVGTWLWLHALKRAVNAMVTYVECKEGLNTMFDPLCACARIMEEALSNNVNEIEAFGLGISAAEETAQKTKVPPKKYPDPGAHAVGIWMRALYEGVKLRCE